MIYEFVSSRTVIARLNRYFNDRNWVVQAKMDLGDLIQEIGYATQRTNTCQSDPIEVINHKAELPCDLRFIEKVEHQGDRLPINRDVSMLALTNDKYTWSKTGMGNWYMIQPPFIKTSFDEGEIIIFYRKYVCDDEGYLMIPDEAEYRKALEWGMIKSLLLQGYKLKNNLNLSFAYIDDQFETYKDKARNKCKRMSKDERLMFSRYWNTLDLTYVGDQVLRDTE